MRRFDGTCAGHTDAHGVLKDSLQIGIANRNSWIRVFSVEFSASSAKSQMPLSLPPTAITYVAFLQHINSSVECLKAAVCQRAGSQWPSGQFA